MNFAIVDASPFAKMRRLVGRLPTPRIPPPCDCSVTSGTPTPSLKTEAPPLVDDSEVAKLLARGVSSPEIGTVGGRRDGPRADTATQLDCLRKNQYRKSVLLLMADRHSLRTVNLPGTDRECESEGGAMGVFRWVIGGIGAYALGALGATAPAVAGAVAGGGTVETAAAVVTADDQHAQLERLGELLHGATPGSPAHFRLKEEQDRLVRSIDLAAQLWHVDGVFVEATSGSPAQFRAREEADSLREELKRLGRG